jgi:phosphate transport system substrate-binding protein
MIGLLLTFATTAFAAGTPLEGTVKIDGSSTVFPITEAIAEEFQKGNPKVRVTAGVSGTGGGYKKFVAGETDINDASRAVKGEELKTAAGNKIEMIELPIAFDGISVVVNPKNTWVKTLSFAQLKKLWEPDSKVKTWKDLDPSWPDKAIKLYGPGADNGTFEYFTEEVNGKAKASRSDYTASPNPNIQINGISSDENALGYFGFAYYGENKTKLKLIPIASDKTKGEAVEANEQSIESGKYPLARPLFIVVNKKSAERPEVDAFVKFYLANAKEFAKAVGYIALPAKMYEDSTKRYASRQVGAWSAGSSSH